MIILSRSVPVGFERQVVMHSLSFREYLEARGFGPDALAVVKRSFERREMVPDAVNARFHALFREYVVVGGMPAVVSAFVERGHYGEVQTLQESLVADQERNGHAVRYYRNDDAEIEFIVETEDGVVPIEVKSTDGRSRSLDALLESETIPYGIKLTGGNVGISGKKVTLPHYMAMFLQSICD